MDELTAELRSFLDQRRCAVLATHDPGGTIHLTPIWFLFEGGCFYFESSSTRSEGQERRRKSLSLRGGRCARAGTGAMGVRLRPSWDRARRRVGGDQQSHPTPLPRRASARRPTRSRPRRGGRCDAQACADRVAVLGGAGDAIARATLPRCRPLAECHTSAAYCSSSGTITAIAMGVAYPKTHKARLTIVGLHPLRGRAGGGRGLGSD